MAELLDKASRELEWLVTCESDEHKECIKGMSQICEFFNAQILEMKNMSELLEEEARLYEKYEQRITDVFNMEMRPISEPMFATSYFAQLERHEYLMPIRRMSTPPVYTGSQND